MEKRLEYMCNRMGNIGCLGKGVEYCIACEIARIAELAIGRQRTIHSLE